MIPQSFIQDLLARIDIVDVVGRHVRLKKAGSNYHGLCPFHAEKTPSFTVSPTKQFYHCFGCGAHGSAVQFLMEQGGLGFVDAVTELARSLGLEVPRESGGSGAPDPRAPGLLELIGRASAFYRQRLRETPRAIEYLKSRGMTGETARRFGIGYAPDQWRGLEAAVPDYDDPALVEAGLVIEADGGDRDGRRRRYDRFRDRIVFPIRNGRGQVIGFGGRVLDRGEPKYLNSPETPLFSKGRELYGLFEARDGIRRNDCVIVVEGYMDVAMLSQHGIDHAVATLGTSTTPDHVRKLLKMADRVVFAFDGDKAGRKAAWRALEASLPHTADSKRIDFLFLPPEHDPDSYVRHHGADGFRQALTGAMPLSELLVGELAERIDLGTPEGRANFLSEAAPLIGQLAAPGLRLQLLHRIAELSRLSVAEVTEYFAGAAPSASTTTRPERPRPLAGASDSPARPVAASRAGAWRARVGKPDLEARVRWLVALHPELATGIERGRWLSESLSGWIETLAGLPAGSTLAQAADALREQSPALVAQIDKGIDSDAAALAGLSAEEAASELRAALGQLRDRQLRREIDELAKGGIRTDEERRRYQELVAMRRKLTDTITG